MISFADVPPEIMQAMITPMHLIPLPVLPGNASQRQGSLYLGSLSATGDTQLLEAHRITHIVQVIDVPWLDPSIQQKYRCYHIKVDDLPTVELGAYLEAVCEWVERALRAGGNVLVHCQQGISRSPAIVIAYLIRQHAMSYDDAYALCKSTRACVKPNRGFVRSLREWEIRCKDRRLQSHSSVNHSSGSNATMSRPDFPRRFTN